MKTKLIALAVAVCTLSACQKEIRLEVKQINETDKTAQWDINVTRPVFASTETEVEKNCVRFNDEVTGLVNGIRAAFMEQSKETIARLDSAGMQQMAPYELYIRDSVFLADENYISVLMSTYEMMGGANGINNFYAVNYDMKNQKFLDMKEILNMNKASEINALLKQHLNDPDQCFTFAAPTVANVTAVNFTLDDVEFTYNKYILGPGACGTVTIAVPRDKMNGMLILK